MTILDPKFDQVPIGQLKKDSSIYSVLFGTDGILLENELNEIQWLQIERLSLFLKEQYGNGIVGDVDLEISGNDFKVVNKKNSPVSILIDGFLLRIADKDQVNYTSVDIGGTNLYSGKNLIVLETWFEEISGASNNQINKLGTSNSDDTITYPIIDSRIGKETSKRIQMKWKLRVIKNKENMVGVNPSLNTYPSVNYQPIDGENLYVVYKDNKGEVFVCFI
jgi:hypothetical protein